MYTVVRTYFLDGKRSSYSDVIYIQLKKIIISDKKEYAEI